MKKKSIIITAVTTVLAFGMTAVVVLKKRKNKRKIRKKAKNEDIIDTDDIDIFDDIDAALADEDIDDAGLKDKDSDDALDDLEDEIPNIWFAILNMFTSASFENKLFDYAGVNAPVFLWNKLIL